MERDLTMDEEKRKNRCCLPPSSPTPWLVYTHGNSRKRKMQTFCTISSSSRYTEYCFKSIPQLRDKEVWYSTDGWLVLRDLSDSKSLSLWNTISLQAIQLPPLDGEINVSCAFVLPSGDYGNDIGVFFIANEVAFSIHPFGNNSSWVVRSIGFLGERVGVSDVIICNGVIYGHARYDLVVIEVNNNSGSPDGLEAVTFRSLGLKEPDAGFSYAGHFTYILESCGRVYLVVIHALSPEYRRIFEVNIWELDLILMKWVQVKCLDGRAFFIGSESSTWCWGYTNDDESGGVRGNSVYFFVPEDFCVARALYMYNLEDSSVTSLSQCPDLPSPFYASAWIMSQYQSFTGEGSHKHNVETVGALDQCCDSTESHGQEEGEVIEKFLLCELPEDLIQRVAQQLHLFDYLNFRATNKLFNNLAPLDRWRTNDSYPLLMFFESEDPLCRLMDPCRSDSRYMVFPESLGGMFHIFFAKDGWLLLSTDGGEGLEFINPFMGVRRTFPDAEFYYEFISTVGFTTCPSSSGCVAVGMLPCDDPIYIFYLNFENDTSEWDRFSFAQQHDFEFSVGSSRPVYYKGAFYFLDSRGLLGVFQLSEAGQWDVYGKPQIPDGYVQSSHLVECDGELLSIFIGEMGKWVRVFKLLQPKMTWVQIKSLGNHTLFISPWSSIGRVARECEMRNRIYLSRWHGDDILFYSLDTGKYSTSKGEDWIEDLSGTKEHIRCCWI